MSDLDCPYCGSGLEICHDDGFGYAEDVRHEYECVHCGNLFIFTTKTVFQYEAKKADCLNGHPHRMRPVPSAQYSGFPDHARCEDCDYEDCGEYQPEAVEAWRKEGSI